MSLVGLWSVKKSQVKPVILQEAISYGILIVSGPTRLEEIQRMSEKKKRGCLFP